MSNILNLEYYAFILVRGCMAFVFDKDNRIPKIARGALKTKQKNLDFIISRQLY